MADLDDYNGRIGPSLIELTATRLHAGSVLMVEVASRRWAAPGCGWHGQRLLRPANHSRATRSLVTRVERESTLLSGGTRTEIIVWTNHGVLVCTPGTVLHILENS